MSQKLGLVDSYKKIKPSLVAIVSRFSRNTDFPDIIGTGFVANSDGLIITNAHVVQAIHKLPRLKSSPNEWPAQVVLLSNIPGIGMSHLTMNIKMVMGFTMDPPPLYLKENPDIGLIEVDIKDLPVAEILSEPSYEEGQKVGIAGFPMGTDLWRAQSPKGHLNQVNPTLRTGHIGAILPFPCDDPHGLLLDVMSQGGLSGSPVFEINSGKVIGVLYSGIDQPKVLTNKDDGTLIYKVPTGISYAVPSHFLSKVLQKLNEDKIWNQELKKKESLKFIQEQGIKDYKDGKPKATDFIPVTPADMIVARAIEVDK
jgi:serine protease Do